MITFYNIIADSIHIHKLPGQFTRALNGCHLKHMNSEIQAGVDKMSKVFSE